MAKEKFGMKCKETESAWDRENEVKQKDEVSVAEIWKDFCEHTGFHAYNKLNPEKNKRIRCFWWTLMVMTMSAYLIYTVIAELNNYYSYPFITGFRVEKKDRIPFPAVTLCNQCPLNRSAIGNDSVLNNYFLAQSKLKKEASPIDWSDNETYGEFYTKEHSVDWWREKYGKFESLARMCMFQGERIVPCSDMFMPVFTAVGLCYTFNGNASRRLNVSLSGADNNLVMIIMVEQDLYVYNQQLSAGYKILLHDPEEHPDSVISEIVTAPGYSTYISMKKTVYKYLPAPYKAFGDSDCVDTTSTTFVNPLKYYKYYTYEHCLLECTAETLFKHCGCVMPNDPPLGPICSLRSQAQCYMPKLMNTRTNTTAQANCQCRDTCTNTAYDVQLSTAGFPSQVWNDFMVSRGFTSSETYAKNNALELRIFFNQMLVETVEQTPVYKTETIVANLGGQMGICLGASILTLTELGEFFVFLFLYLLHRLRLACGVRKTSSQ